MTPHDLTVGGDAGSSVGTLVALLTSLGPGVPFRCNRCPPGRSGSGIRGCLDEGDLDGRFRGSAAASDVLDRATRPRRAARYPTVTEFVSAWRAAIRP
ncbi:MAG: hypothetical protein ACRDTG_25495 [Pseudonocardiaceae bacterium]